MISNMFAYARAQVPQNTCANVQEAIITIAAQCMNDAAKKTAQYALLFLLLLVIPLIIYGLRRPIRNCYGKCSLIFKRENNAATHTPDFRGIGSSPKPNSAA